jgi:hypothetical protein
MARGALVGGGLEIVDLNGSFARFVKTAPKDMRAVLAGEVKATAFALARRMEAKAPKGPDAPHIKEAVTSKARGLSAQVGYINATQPAGPDSTATIAEVALFNEYRPNRQPFMRPAAEAEASDYVRRMKAAIGQVERNLSGGGGLL